MSLIATCFCSWLYGNLQFCFNLNSISGRFLYYWACFHIMTGKWSFASNDILSMAFLLFDGQLFIFLSVNGIWEKRLQHFILYKVYKTKTLNILKVAFIFVLNLILAPFSKKNCSDLLWEKIVLVIEKNFWNLRLKAENLQKFWDH